MNAEAARLIDQITRAHDGDPWHGTPVKAILAGVTHEQAARRPPNGGHSIWELVLHMTGWRREVARRATGEPAREPEAGDWPPVGDPTAARWQEARAALDASHRDLIAKVKQLSDDRMLQPTNDSRNRELGTGVTYYELLHGIVQHDAYHAGQISILKKVLGIAR